MFGNSSPVLAAHALARNADKARKLDQLRAGRNM